MTKSVHADVQPKNKIIAGLFSRLPLESCVYLQKKYTFYNDRCVDWSSIVRCVVITSLFSEYAK